MKTVVFSLLLTLFVSYQGQSQDLSKFNLYKPSEDAEKALDAAVKEAKKSGKHVFVQAGGNWCIWCARFNDFVTKDASIDSLVQANYVVYHLNYSKENFNTALFKKLGFPQRFGFPVFMVLDGKGKLLHTQNSAYLEEGKGYSKVKVMEFLQHWTPAALDPVNYKEQ
jgi:thioredoxin-related protein